MSLPRNEIGGWRKAQTCAAIAIVVFSAWLAPVCSSLCASSGPTPTRTCGACHHQDSAKQLPLGNQDCPKLVCARLESTVQSLKEDLTELGAVPLPTAAASEMEFPSDLGWPPHRSPGLGPPVPPSGHTVLRA